MTTETATTAPALTDVVTGDAVYYTYDGVDRLAVVTATHVGRYGTRHAVFLADPIDVCGMTHQEVDGDLFSKSDDYGVNIRLTEEARRAKRRAHVAAKRAERAGQ